ncbi:MAG TPA: peptidoglycan DD-metalloendopeptidase family protein [Tenuifilaceae bacterium]|nr:peptidoglycan DD-metalloendopeptidase family protein [Tenuifilaceae bacterium]
MPLNRWNKSTVFCLLLLFYSSINFAVFAQNPEYQPPLNIPYAISSSFAEIRLNHLHSGIDLRTNGIEGFSVFSIYDGYVSRIKVSSVGFGKALYITHPNGLTSVYAHLQSFSKNIDKYVKKEQYEKQSFEVELFPLPGEIPVKKGDIIGISGNSGSSGGPHLHFEVRNTLLQWPKDPLIIFNEWKRDDQTAPVIRAIYLYDIDSLDYLYGRLHKKKITLLKKGNLYTSQDTISSFNKTGLGINLFDIVNKKSLRCGIKQILFKQDDKVIFSYAIDSFSYNNSRYANSLIDYGSLVNDNKRIIKLWTEPNNKLNGMWTDQSKGIVDFTNSKLHKLEVEITDNSNNKAYLKLYVKPGKSITRIDEEPKHGQLIIWNKPQKIVGKNFTITFKPNTFYHNILLPYQLNYTENKTIISIANWQIPVNNKFAVELDSNIIDSKLGEKSYLAYHSKKGIVYTPSVYANGKLNATCQYLGEYSVEVDTICPSIIPQNISDKVSIQNQKSIKFKIIDNTDIETYTGTIDGKWALFEWDPKNSLLEYLFDNDYIEQHTWHTLTLSVFDVLNNESIYKCSFFW